MLWHSKFIFLSHGFLARKLSIKATKIHSFSSITADLVADKSKENKLVFQILLVMEINICQQPNSDLRVTKFTHSKTSNHTVSLSQKWKESPVFQFPPFLSSQTDNQGNKNKKNQSFSTTITKITKNPQSHINQELKQPLVATFLQFHSTQTKPLKITEIPALESEIPWRRFGF